ncbi:HAD-IA family hydrolase [Galactobacter caseinivorans]|uniref:HAD family hydrolase n=1 Tax=Galactobacter caseinivorans TaxID=2676123 RepID=A0A496PHJ0_9MICC|nr:HAD-IA family hydrolase [Galactobacter caseinivorans]RKW69954.1 HAD family hydrolase [Galactobacter caseinivorans]
MSTRTLFDGLDAILFDLDGTLIDSTPVTTNAWARWGRELGIGRTDYHDHGVPARQVIQGVIDTQDLAPERFQEALDLINHLEETDTDGVVRLPGVAQVLASLPQERWTIVTSCTNALAAVRLGAVGWDAPNNIVTADMVSQGKPAPEGYLLGAQRLGADPARCLVVEDAPAGLAAARAAGMRSLGLTGTFTADLLDADVVLDGLQGVRAARGADGTLTLLLED